MVDKEVVVVVGVGGARVVGVEEDEVDSSFEKEAEADAAEEFSLDPIVLPSIFVLLNLLLFILI